MTPLFADTFFYLALLNPRDRRHHESRLILRNAEVQFMTTEFVLLELVDAYASPQVRPRVLALLSHLRQDPETRIIPVSTALFSDGLALFRSRPDKGWSLTDCTSFVVMEKEGLSEALTGDAHFQQAGFKPLLRA